MKLSRRSFVAAVTGSMAIPGNLKGQTLWLDTAGKIESLREYVNGDQWLRVQRTNEGHYVLKAGIGKTETIKLERALGVKWYRNDGIIPDGQRRVYWNTYEHVGNSDLLFRMSGSIKDSLEGEWEAVTEVRNDIDGFRMKNTFTRKGNARAASVRVHAVFNAPPVKSFTMIPGAVYNGNRADIVVPRGYNPMLTYDEVMQRESRKNRRVIADIPRQDASTWWTVHLWGHQSASASVSAFDISTKAGAHVGFARTDGKRITGVIHTTDPDIPLNEVVVENPCVRERRYRNCVWQPSSDKPWRFENGEQAVVELRLSSVVAENIPSFVSAWTKERELRRKGKAPGRNSPNPPTPNVIPRSEATRLAIEWNNKSLWTNNAYYRTIHLNENHPREIINGWGSGNMAYWPMLVLGSDEVKYRTCKTIDYILDHGRAPGGLFYGVKLNTGTWISSDGNLDSMWAMNALTPRRTTDTIIYGFPIADLLLSSADTDQKKLGEKLDKALLKACEALQRVWYKEKGFPFLLDPHTEKSVWRGSHGGARALSCLVTASTRWKNPSFLKTAEEIAAQFVNTGLSIGETWGGPSDIMQGTTDNESLTALTEGLCLLYEKTKKPLHLKWATQGADLLSTWVLDEHIEFPKNSILGSNGIDPFGAMIASTQNAWGTPGMCVNSGLFLLKLYEWTGQERFMDMLSDINRVAMQMMVTENGKWGTLEPGQMTECSSFNDIPGDFGHAYLRPATWPVNSMMLAEIELPSIYIDGKKIWNLDHMEVKVQPDGQFKIFNPTKHPANLSIKRRNGASERIRLMPSESKLIPA